MSDKIMAECEQLRRDKRELEQQVSSARHRLEADYCRLKAELAKAKDELCDIRCELALGAGTDDEKPIVTIRRLSAKLHEAKAENVDLLQKLSGHEIAGAMLAEQLEKAKAENVRLAAAMNETASVYGFTQPPDCYRALRDLLAPTIEAVSLAEQWMARPKHGMPDRQAIVLTLKNELVRLSKYTHRTL